MKSVTTHVRNIVALCDHRPELTNILLRRRATNYNHTIANSIPTLNLTDMKKKHRRAVCKILYFALLPIAAFAYWMSLVSEDIERFYGKLDREIYPNKYGND